MRKFSEISNRNMKIYLTCKLDAGGALGFIKPLADIEHIKKIAVFRYEEALPCSKVTYYKTISAQKGHCGHIKRFMLMLRRVSADMQLGIGIYEMPHGLLAFVIGKIKRIPVAICIIGNPGYNVIRKGIYKKATYFMLNRVAAITVTGNRSKEFLRNDGIKNVPIYILPNSIDIEHFQKIKTDKTYDILSLGRLSPEKELLILLKIIEKLKDDNSSIKCAIAGQGPEASNLKESIKQMGLENNVSLLGYVDDIVTFYNSGKIFVLTSSTEGLPRSVLEAMACGIPCVASRVGDMEDAIAHGTNGYLIEHYDDVDAYVEKIQELLSDFDKYQNFSNKTEDHIKKSFSYNAASLVWEQIIRDIHGGSIINE